MNTTFTDCRDEDGKTVGLIDAILTISRILANRDLSPKSVREALKDLRQDEDLKTLLTVKERPKITFSAWREEEMRGLVCKHCENGGKLSFHTYAANIMKRVNRIEWLCLYCGKVTESRPKLIQYLADWKIEESSKPYYGECSNCHAKLTAEHPGGKGPDGQKICCGHCAFNPLGCRCKYGEYGEPETRHYY